MALQRGKLADIQYISDSADDIYANPASTKTYIRELILHNTNTTTETVTLYNVPDSAAALGTASGANQFAKILLVADETLHYAFEHPIVLTDENDSIQAVTTTASKVTVQILGDKDA